LPKFVQIGNETDCGLLWPDGYICDESNTAEQWLNLGILYNNAISGIQDAIDEMDTVWTLGHLSHGGLWYFSNLFNEGVSLDIIGQSYYPWWHGSLDELSTNLTQLSNEFQKPIVIVETAYPFTLSWNDNTNNIIGMESQLLDGFPASEIGQLNFLQAVKDRVTNNEFGAGICYWSPEWISTETFGSPWENLALFDFNSEVLDGITVFENDNTGIDENINPEHIKLKLFPNPFNPITNIHYEIQRSGFVEIMIYNINGELVESIVKQDQHKGEHSVLWNSEGLSSGVYFYQLKLNGEVLGTKQAVLIK
jgi:arabinogalactan endo-1,4-beta-galactosidase